MQKNIQIRTNDLEAIRVQYAKEYKVSLSEVKFVYETED